MNKYQKQYQKETGAIDSHRLHYWRGFVKWLIEKVENVISYNRELYEDNEKVKKLIHLLYREVTDEEDNEREL